MKSTNKMNGKDLFSWKHLGSVLPEWQKNDKEKKLEDIEQPSQPKKDKKKERKEKDVLTNSEEIEDSKPKQNTTKKLILLRNFTVLVFKRKYV